jgi:hypothetical protein
VNPVRKALKALLRDSVSAFSRPHEDDLDAHTGWSLTAFSEPIPEHWLDQVDANKHPVVQKSLRFTKERLFLELQVDHIWEVQLLAFAATVVEAHFYPADEAFSRSALSLGHLAVLRNIFNGPLNVTVTPAALNARKKDLIKRFLRDNDAFTFDSILKKEKAKHSLFNIVAVEDERNFKEFFGTALPRSVLVDGDYASALQPGITVLTKLQRVMAEVLHAAEVECVKQLRDHYKLHAGGDGNAAVRAFFHVLRHMYCLMWEVDHRTVLAMAASDDAAAAAAATAAKAVSEACTSPPRAPTTPLTSPGEPGTVSSAGSSSPSAAAPGTDPAASASAASGSAHRAARVADESGTPPVNANLESRLAAAAPAPAPPAAAAAAASAPAAAASAATALTANAKAGAPPRVPATPQAPPDVTGAASSVTPSLPSVAARGADPAVSVPAAPGGKKPSRKHEKLRAAVAE